MGLPGGLSAIEGGATGHSVSGGLATGGWRGVAAWGGCGAGLFFAGAGRGELHGCTSAWGFTRDGTGGGGVLEALGRLTSEEVRDWEEPRSAEVALMVREGAGDGGREEALEGTSGSAERETALITASSNRGPPDQE